MVIGDKGEDEFVWTPFPGDDEKRPGLQDCDAACSWVWRNIWMPIQEYSRAEEKKDAFNSSGLSLIDTRIIRWQDREKLLDADQKQLADYWNELKEYVDEFDDFKQSLSGRELPKLGGRLFWRVWRQTLGDHCGIDVPGIEVITEIQKNTIDDVPNWGTRHTYNFKEEEE